MHVLCLAGGGFKGAFQVPVIRHLIETEHVHYDLVMGVSVGSINGAMTAQRDLPALDRIWSSINDNFALNGIRGYLRLALLGFRGFYSLKPFEQKLDENVDHERLAIPVEIGVAVRDTGLYVGLRYTAQAGTCRGVSLHDAILGSSAIAPLMESRPVVLDGQPRLLADGGHVHVLPVPPDDATEIDAVFNVPVLSREFHGGADPNIFAATTWALENQLTLSAAFDFHELAERTATTRVRVFAPPAGIGSLLHAGQGMIERRMAWGAAAAKMPITFRNGVPEKPDGYDDLTRRIERGEP